MAAKEVAGMRTIAPPAAFVQLAMILHGISDIRHLIENDARFLQQF